MINFKVSHLHTNKCTYLSTKSNLITIKHKIRFSIKHPQSDTLSLLNICNCPTIMKAVLFLSAALVATASATAEVGCEDCKALVSTLGMYLSSEESISKQVEILLAEVCPGAQDPDACVEKLPDFWSQIASMLWPTYYNPERVFMCMQEGLCGAPGAR